MRHTVTVDIGIAGPLDDLEIEEVKRRIVDSLRWLGFVTIVDVQAADAETHGSDSRHDPRNDGTGFSFGADCDPGDCTGT